MLGAWDTFWARAMGTSAEPGAGSCPKTVTDTAKIRQTGSSAAHWRAREYIIGYNSPLYWPDEAGREHFTRALPGDALNRHSRSTGDSGRRDCHTVRHDP